VCGGGAGGSGGGSGCAYDGGRSQRGDGTGALRDAVVLVHSTTATTHGSLISVVRLIICAAQ